MFSLLPLRGIINGDDGEDPQAACYILAVDAATNVAAAKPMTSEQALPGSLSATDPRLTTLLWNVAEP